MPPLFPEPVFWKGISMDGRKEAPRKLAGIFNMWPLICPIKSLRILDANAAHMEIFLRFHEYERHILNS